MKFLCPICEEEVREDDDDHDCVWIHADGSNIWSKHAQEFEPIERRKEVGDDVLEMSVVNILAFEKEYKARPIENSPIKVEIIEKVNE
jgi:hypothetical protein